MYKESGMSEWLKNKGEHNHRSAEDLGWYTSSHLSGLVGWGIGHRFGKAREGYLAGLLGTAIAAPIIGKIAAAITRRRTLEEQKKHDEGSAWLDGIIPGLSSYNSAKREELADHLLNVNTEI